LKKHIKVTKILQICLKKYVRFVNFHPVSCTKVKGQLAFVNKQSRCFKIINFAFKDFEIIRCYWFGAVVFGSKLDSSLDYGHWSECSFDEKILIYVLFGLSKRYLQKPDFHVLQQIWNRSEIASCLQKSNLPGLVEIFNPMFTGRKNQEQNSVDKWERVFEFKISTTEILTRENALSTFHIITSVFCFDQICMISHVNKW